MLGDRDKGTDLSLSVAGHEEFPLANPGADMKGEQESENVGEDMKYRGYTEEAKKTLESCRKWADRVEKEVIGG